MGSDASTVHFFWSVAWVLASFIQYPFLTVYSPVSINSYILLHACLPYHNFILCICIKACELWTL
jgi:hypothetical protein